jgi:hypothetical protein
MRDRLIGPTGWKLQVAKSHNSALVPSTAPVINTRPSNSDSGCAEPYVPDDVPTRTNVSAAGS